jgi:RsgA GTPase
VLPRRSAIVRKVAGLTSESQTLATNVDLAFIVSSLGPDLDPRRIERYLVTISESGASPEIVLTKADRFDDPREMVASVEAVAIGVPVHVVSAVSGYGLDALRARLSAGETALLIGSSGVGKSTLVNRWVRRELMATNGDARRRRRGSSHDDAPRADRASGRRRRDRHPGDPRAAAMGRERQLVEHQRRDSRDPAEPSPRGESAGDCPAHQDDRNN